MIAEIARQQLEIRIRVAQQRVAAASDRILAATEWNARLAPWLAAAVYCGVDIARFDAGHAADLAAGHSRGTVAHRICPQPEMRAEIARARDAALAAVIAADGTADPRNAARSKAAQDLAILAIHLGCPKAQLVELREAA